MTACNFKQVPPPAFAPFTAYMWKYVFIILAFIELEENYSLVPSLCLIQRTQILDYNIGIFNYE